MDMVQSPSGPASKEDAVLMAGGPRNT